jgi:1,4-alpha-glucan branching enzyme
MSTPQDHIHAGTPMGANLVAGGATFRVWAPRARAVHVGYDGHWDPVEDNRLERGPAGHWTGFVPGIGEGTRYKFFVVGSGSSGYKRDPFARELTTPFPASDCVVRDPNRYPWHDQGFRRPAFSDLVIYEMHVGGFYSATPGRAGRFLDVLSKVPHLVDLGVNAVELMPVVEFPSEFSQGYNGTDYFSPEMDYGVDDDDLGPYVATMNDLLARAGRARVSAVDLTGSMNQLKALIDVLHVYGIAVILDAVYNHAGGGFDDGSIYFFDRAVQGDNNDSLYFTAQGHAGGLLFAFWNADVRQFLIDNALYYLDEHHVDGFRYDRMEVPVHESPNGWQFCQSLTGTVRHREPSAVQISEYWPPDPWTVKDGSEGGAGFDAAWQNTVRYALRGALGQASLGRDAYVDLGSLANAFAHPQLPLAWKEVHCVENHDEVQEGRTPRVPALADGADARSWYARSRSRVALGLLGTGPGIPLLFMGQEFLVAGQWSERRVLPWGDLDDRVHADFLHCARDIIALRRRLPALRGPNCNPYHVHNENRVLAHHRWLEGTGDDVVIVASLNDSTFGGYEIGFPGPGPWREVFNSDAYDNWPNSWVAGNGGGVFVGGPPTHGLPASATITVPANSVVVFTR